MTQIMLTRQNMLSLQSKISMIKLIQTKINLIVVKAFDFLLKLQIYHRQKSALQKKRILARLQLDQTYYLQVAQMALTTFLVKNFECCFLRQINRKLTSIRGQKQQKLCLRFHVNFIRGRVSTKTKTEVVCPNFYKLRLS